MPIPNELPALAMPIVTTTYETVEIIPSNFMRRFALRASGVIGFRI